MKAAEGPGRDGQEAGEQVYPAEFHFRIIVEAQGSDVVALREALSTYRVTAPLAPSRVSSGSGRYQSYSVSIELRSRTEMVAFDANMRRVPGVRMIV